MYHLIWMIFLVAACTHRPHAFKYLDGSIRVNSQLKSNASLSSYIRNNPSAKTLRVPFYQIDDDGFGDITSLTQLEALDVSHTRIGARSVKEFSKLKNLAFFAANGTPFDDECMEHMSKATELQVLYLSDTLITYKAMAYIAKLKKLKYLSISHTSITESSLSEIPGSVVYLNVRGVEISASGLHKLSRLKSCTDLTISGDGLKSNDLSLLSGMESLSSLYLMGTIKLEINDLRSFIKKTPSLKYLSFPEAHHSFSLKLKGEFPKIEITTN